MVPGGASAKLLPAQSPPIDDNVVPVPVFPPDEPLFDLHTMHHPSVTMAGAVEILLTDCIPNHPAQLIKQLPDVGVMRGEQR
jgi:hypothetical protein